MVRGDLTHQINSLKVINVLNKECWKHSPAVSCYRSVRDNAVYVALTLCDRSVWISDD